MAAAVTDGMIPHAYGAIPVPTGQYEQVTGASRRIVGNGTEIDAGQGRRVTSGTLDHGASADLLMG